MSNLHTLGNAIRAYSDEHDGKYPALDKWCDLLIESCKTVPRQLMCRGALEEGDRSSCHYAINPNCEPNCPRDMVLLFETKGGWNQYGGPEILTTENHGGKGCGILFNDGSVRFVKTEELGTLKWKVEDANSLE